MSAFDYQVTFVRVTEGTTHPAGIYLNAEQLAFVLLDVGEEKAAEIVGQWVWACEANEVLEPQIDVGIK